MPHFRDGTPAKVGDRVRFKTGRYDGNAWVGVEREGVLIHLTPGASTCNGLVAFATLDTSNADARIVTNATQHVTLGECSKAELPLAEAGGEAGAGGVAVAAAGRQVLMGGTATQAALVDGKAMNEQLAAVEKKALAGAG